MFHLIGQLIFGLVIGVIAKLVVPGHDPGGFFVTALVGMAGSFVGTHLGRALKKNPSYQAGWLTSILGAVVLLIVYRLIF
jgi:uncharacterized membrane protein YeaQ/YmgE (transglycosylase-associated protein family)